MRRKEILFVSLIMCLLFCFYYIEINLLHRTFLAPLTCKAAACFIVIVVSNFRCAPNSR